MRWVFVPLLNYNNFLLEIEGPSRAKGVAIFTSLKITLSLQTAKIPDAEKIKFTLC